MNARTKAKPVPLVLTATAVQDKGLDEVYAELERLIRQHHESGRLQEKKRVRLESEIKAALEDELWGRFLSLGGDREDIAALADRLARSGESPYPAIREIGSRIRMQFDTAKKD